MATPLSEQPNIFIFDVTLQFYLISRMSRNGRQEGKSRNVLFAMCMSICVYKQPYSIYE